MCRIIQICKRPSTTISKLYHDIGQNGQIIFTKLNIQINFIKLSKKLSIQGIDGAETKDGCDITAHAHNFDIQIWKEEIESSIIKY